MRRSSTRGAKLAVAAVLASMLAGTVGAHAAPSPLWIEQDGNGSGDTTPIISDFNAREVLFNGSRFPLPNGTTQRPGMQKYAAYGTVEELDQPIPGLILARVGLATADDGYRFTDPRTLTVHDTETGVDVPLIVNDPTDHFGVTFGDLPAQIMGNGPGRIGFQFALYYRDHAAATHAFTDLHVAVSADGAAFELDQKLSQVGTTVVGAGESTFGPTQLFFNGTGSTTCTTAPLATNFPWNCRAAMLIPVGTAAGEVLRLAGSGDGLSWLGGSGSTGPATILAPGAPGSWDDRFVSLGHIQKLAANNWVLYYSGAEAASAGDCFAGESACFSLGVATSTDGLTWTKVPQNPIVPRALYETALPGAPASLWYPVPVAGSSTTCGVTTPQDKLYLNVIRGGSSGAVQRDLWAAKPTNPPAAGPSIRVDSPAGGPLPQAVKEITAYATDTLGTNVGLNMGSLSLNFDGGPALTGVAVEDSIVGALKTPAKKITVANAFGALADGPHTLNVSIADLDGNLSSLARPFSIDTSVPDTAMTTPAPSPQIQIPLDSIGTYEGTSTDAVSPLLSLRAIVTNPLGQQKAFEIRKVCNQMTTPTNGFSILSESNGGKTWNWRWVGPTFDLHMLLPGPYSVSVVAVDQNQNIEHADSTNSANVLVI